MTYSIFRKLEAYADAVRLAGVEPVPIAPGQPASLAGLDGLVITGGCDIDPARYGQAPLAINDAPDKDRDELEAALLSQAIDADLPVLAICRGLQLLNVVCRGTLKQDIPGHKAKGIAEAHPVTVRLWFEARRDFGPDGDLRKLAPSSGGGPSRRRTGGFGRGARRNG